MKLLLDENLSRRIVPFLENEYPASTQVTLIGMEQASDREVWEYAKTQDFVIVTHDSDFYELSLLYGQPPKVIWLKSGNQTKASTVNILKNNLNSITKALLDNDKACIENYQVIFLGGLLACGQTGGYEGDGIPYPHYVVKISKLSYNR